jgi:hypothetical protein
MQQRDKDGRRHTDGEDRDRKRKAIQAMRSVWRRDSAVLVASCAIRALVTELSSGLVGIQVEGATG